MSKDNGGPASDKIQQARRAAFEVWTKREHGNLDLRKDGEYFDDLTHGAWLGFNAALDCVVIELPPELHAYTGQPQEDRLLDADRNHTIKQCRTAIESTNLGIKVK